MTTLTAPPPVLPAGARRRDRRRLGAAAVTVAALAALAALPLAVSGWDPTGGRGARSTAAVAGAVDLSATVAPGAVTHLATVGWSGPTAWPLTPPSGRVTVDGWVGRLADEDASADYYVVVLETAWMHEAGLARLPAPVRIRVTSDRPAVDNVYGATPSFVSDGGCDTEVATPAVPQAGNGSAVACRGYGVALVGQDATTVTWEVDQPAGLRTVQLVLQQKVPQGATPVWSVELEAPSGAGSGVPWSVGAVTRTTVAASLTA